MSPNSDPIVFYSIVGALAAQLLVLIGWCIALIGVRRPLFWILIFSSLLSLGFATVNTLMAYDPRIIMRLFTSRENYQLFYHGFARAQATNAFVFLVGQILLVRWMLNVTRSSRRKTATVIDRLI